MSNYEVLKEISKDQGGKQRFPQCTCGIWNQKDLVTERMWGKEKD